MKTRKLVALFAGLVACIVWGSVRSDHAYHAAAIIIATLILAEVVA